MKSWKQRYCGMWTEQKQLFPYWGKKRRRKKQRESSHLDVRLCLTEEESVQDGWRRLLFPSVSISRLQLGLFALCLPKYCRRLPVPEPTPFLRFLFTVNLCQLSLNFVSRRAFPFPPSFRLCRDSSFSLTFLCSARPQMCNDLLLRR